MIYSFASCFCFDWKSAAKLQVPSTRKGASKGKKRLSSIFLNKWKQHSHQSDGYYCWASVFCSWLCLWQLYSHQQLQNVFAAHLTPLRGCAHAETLFNCFLARMLQSCPVVPVYLWIYIKKWAYILKNEPSILATSHLLTKLRYSLLSKHHCMSRPCSVAFC